MFWYEFWFVSGTSEGLRVTSFISTICVPIERTTKLITLICNIGNGLVK